jgi:cbb3-type cytochrome oxidase subunit 3
MIDWIATHATLIGLVFFFSFFVLTALWIYRPGSRASYQKQAHIPLHEDHHG